MTVQPRKVVRFGPYRVLERLGQGGMSTVFRARHEASDHECALKVLREDRRNDEATQDLFVTEADVAMLLDHPNLIRTYDAGEIDGRHYIAMELIEGGSLGRLLADCRLRQIPLAADLVLFIMSEILDGLHGLHEASGHTGRPLGLIHRDLTPQNIFLSFDGRVVLGDFGVALIQAYGNNDPGQVLGKLGYLAPEMILTEEVDRRADLFAAGVVLYEALTGTKPFDGESDEKVMTDIAEGRFARPRRHKPSLDKGLENVILKSLARRPKDRAETAEDMLLELEPYWSKQLANPLILSGFLAALWPDEAANWRARRQPVLGQPTAKTT